MVKEKTMSIKWDILTMDMTGTAFKLYYYLKWRDDETEGDLMCSFNEIGKDLNLSILGVRNNLKLLEKNGLIEVEKIIINNGIRDLYKIF